MFLSCLRFLYIYGACLGVFRSARLVLNQRQLFIVVSDWGPYLGSHMPWIVFGLLSMCSCLSVLVSHSVTVVLDCLFILH